MSKNIFIEPLVRTPIEEQEVEIVERKGIGHPDSVADGLAESVSRGLCREYIKRYDRILHHNTDQTEVVGGLAKAEFGGGQIVQPMYILLVGRATMEVEREKIPVGSIAIHSAKEYLKKSLGTFNVESDAIVDCKIGMGSIDLKSVYDTRGLLANDTSFGVSFAPLSETEQIALNVEKFINGPLKKKLPEVGEDVKVMALRDGDEILLTVAAAMIGKHIKDLDDYVSIKEELAEYILDNARKYTDRKINVQINTADNPKKGVIYLTVTGLSMENGDDGSVGRGNRVNGLITPNRPMSMEAAAGKNPVTHVGKLYNLLSLKIAEDVYKEAGGDIREIHVKILSQIGTPINKPKAANAQIIMANGVKLERVKNNVYGIMDNWLENIDKITKMIVNNEITVF
jgi:S-adenosylmethionine synthetase